MHQILNDPIDISIDFIGNRAVPKSIHWGGRTYHMRTVNLIHSAREGIKKIFYFSVSDNTNFMKLKLDTDTLEWRLVEIYTD
ncbi:hypothetical protein KJ766_00270 [Patescibacteria group bacterium]|nr:hypothetical protein [Patescibacteria group bacterium]